MTPELKCLDEFPEASEVDDAQIHALAWAIVEGVLDCQTARLSLLHAAALLKATMAITHADPISAATEMLKEHAEATLDLTRTAIAMNDQPPRFEDTKDPDWGHL